jgi:hypothetical protein
VWSWRDIGITFWRGAAAWTGKLEGGGNRRRYGWLDFDTLTSEYIVQVLQFKARNTAFKNGIALGEFLFEMLGVTAKGEGLAVPVLLVTRRARGCASGASWVF